VLELILDEASHRLGRRLTVIDPKKEGVALMTGALEAPAEERVH
jgi:fructose transport system ATP-binding protein